MNQRLKVFLSVFFVLSVTFFVARAFWPPAGGGSASGGKPSAPPKQAVKVATKKKPAKPAVVPVARPAVPAGQDQPRMAIILDDWGASGAHVDDVVALKRPLTLAVIPHLRRSQMVAEEAYAHGLGVMLHMPMQPKDRKPSEPHAILATMTDAQIRGLLDEALESIPHVEGVNNHQGSAATSDLRVMTTVLSHLKKKGLFFVDSKVIASSQCAQAAKKTGIRFASRDVFIDNVAVVDAVKEQLRRAIRIARQTGQVVVIGHDKSATLEAIRLMVPEIERNGVKLVLAEELAEAVG